MSMLDMLRGAMAGAIGKKGPNDGSARAKAQEEYEAAMAHQQNVYHSTNDPGQRKDADQRLYKAREALGQF